MQGVAADLVAGVGQVVDLGPGHVVGAAADHGRVDVVGADHGSGLQHRQRPYWLAWPSSKVRLTTVLVAAPAGRTARPAATTNATPVRAMSLAIRKRDRPGATRFPPKQSSRLRSPERRVNSRPRNWFSCQHCSCSVGAIRACSNASSMAAKAAYTVCSSTRPWSRPPSVPAIWWPHLPHPGYSSRSHDGAERYR
jgi:hypothetical protein